MKSILLTFLCRCVFLPIPAREGLNVKCDISEVEYTYLQVLVVEATNSYILHL